MREKCIIIHAGRAKGIKVDMCTCANYQVGKSPYYLILLSELACEVAS